MSKAKNAVPDDSSAAEVPKITKRRRGKAIPRKKPQVVQLTDRDIRILNALSSGPAIFDRLLTIVREDEDEESLTSKVALRKKVAHLTRGKYIHAEPYHNRKGRGYFCLYGIKELAISVLIEHGIQRDHMRMNIPGELGVVHELMVTDVVRTLRRGHATKVYTLVELKDENKRKQETRGGKKNRVYEDLKVCISYMSTKKDVTKRYLSFEIDNNTIDADKVVAKIKLLDRKVIVLCPTPARIEKLRAEFIATQDKELCENVVLGNVNDFCETGLAGATLSNPWGRPVRILPEYL